MLLRIIKRKNNKKEKNSRNKAKDLLTKDKGFLQEDSEI